MPLFRVCGLRVLQLQWRFSLYSSRMVLPQLLPPYCTSLGNIFSWQNELNKEYRKKRKESMCLDNRDVCFYILSQCKFPLWVYFPILIGLANDIWPNPKGSLAKQWQKGCWQNMYSTMGTALWQLQKSLLPHVKQCTATEVTGKTPLDWPDNGGLLVGLMAEVATESMSFSQTNPMSWSMWTCSSNFTGTGPSRPQHYRGLTPGKRKSGPLPSGD